MKAVLQRVSYANVTVDEQIVGQIERGFLILLGIGQGDGEVQMQQMVDKIVNLRVFEDDEGKMNRSLLAIDGSALVISQFTLYADIRKGRRPNFINAAPPTLAEPLVERFIAALAAYDVHVESGIFGAHMDIALLNYGPVTIWIDSDEL